MNALFAFVLILLLSPCNNLWAQCGTPDSNGLYCHGKRDMLYFNNDKAVYKLFVEHKYDYSITADEFIAGDSCVLKGQRYQLVVVDRNTINLMQDQKMVFRFKLANSRTIERKILQYQNSLSSDLFVNCQRSKGTNSTEIVEKCHKLSEQLRLDVEKLPHAPLPVFFDKADSIFQYYRRR
jgi:hypothetical protein